MNKVLVNVATLAELQREINSMPALAASHPELMKKLNGAAARLHEKLDDLMLLPKFEENKRHVQLRRER